MPGELSKAGKGYKLRTTWVYSHCIAIEILRTDGFSTWYGVIHTQRQDDTLTMSLVKYTLRCNILSMNAVSNFTFQLDLLAQRIDQQTDLWHREMRCSSILYSEGVT